MPGSLSADAYSSFPNFVVSCSLTLHTRAIDLSDFYGHTQVSLGDRAI